MKAPTFVKQFRRAGRPGAYCRVLREGMVQAGEPVTLRRFEGEPVSGRRGVQRVFSTRSPVKRLFVAN